MMKLPGGDGCDWRGLCGCAIKALRRGSVFPRATVRTFLEASLSELRRTPLYAWHMQHGARIVEFGGWEMPVQYSGLVDEHRAVRERVGLFDVSHMGELRLQGPDALANIQRLTTNDAAAITPGQAQYTALTNPEGGIIDDLLVYRLAATDYLLVVNAGTRTKDWTWISSQLEGDLQASDDSDDWAQLALQGPCSEAVLADVLPFDLSAIGYYRFVLAEYGGCEVIVSRTGYTGEDGFEIYVHPDLATHLADEVLEAGETAAIRPAGLGARDTLRLEAGMLLYGNDMNEQRTPVEAGLSWIVKPDKGDFLGRKILLEQLDEPPQSRLTAFVVTERGIPRQGYALHAGGTFGESIGEVTSGTYSPSLQQGIGLGYLPVNATEPDTALLVDIRGRPVEARVVSLPFYRRPR